MKLPAQEHNIIYPDNDEANRFVIVGRMGSTYGVKGWIKIHSYTDPVESLLDYRPWYINRTGQWQEISMTEGKVHGRGIIAHMEGVDVKEDAKYFAGVEVAVHRDQLPPLETGEFYLDDLPGLNVITIQGNLLGEVQQVLETGASEVLVINGQKQHMVPLVLDRYVKKIDFKQKLVTVDWDPEF